MVVFLDKVVRRYHVANAEAGAEQLAERTQRNNPCWIHLAQQRQVLAPVTQLAIRYVLYYPEAEAGHQLDGGATPLERECRAGRVLKVGHQIDKRRNLAVQRRFQSLDRDPILFERDADHPRAAGRW
jgi:hypothetical protein